MCPYTFKRSDRCQSVYEESPFESIPAACWWCIVTMTTVGYGDMYPTGWVGKLLGCIVMMCGILVIALPITVIGSNFAVVYKVRFLSSPGWRTTADPRPCLWQQARSRDVGVHCPLTHVRDAAQADGK
jgi:hypothetical protein